ELGSPAQTPRSHHVALGTNSRLDSLQAAVLNCRLPFLDGDNDRRRAIAARYRERLDGIGDLRFPEDLPEAQPVYHQLTVRTARRDDLMKHLAAAGGGASIHSPTPLPTHPRP